MNRRTVLHFALGPLATAFMGFVSVPMMAWAFSPEDIGRLNILQIVVSFAVLLLSLGLDQAYVRQYHEAVDPAWLLKTTATPGVLLCALLAVPAAIFARPLSELAYASSERAGAYIWLTLCCAAVALLSRFLSLILRMQERALAFSVSQLLPKAGFLLLVTLVLLGSEPRRFFTLLAIFLLSSTAALVVLLWNTRGELMAALNRDFSLRQAIPLLSYSLPLIVGGVAYWGLTATSALTLRSLSSLRDLGVYSVSMSFAGAATVVQAIFSVVWAPMVYRWVAAGENLSRVDRVARQAVAVVVGLFIVCGIFSWLTDLFLPTSYGAVKYLVLCSVAQPLLYTLSEVTCIGINVTRRTMWSLWATLAALLVNVAGNFVLVPHFGAAGAVVANAVAYLVFLVARTEASAHVWRPMPRAKMYAAVSTVVALSVVTVTFGPATGRLYSFGWLLAAPLALWAFRTEVRELFRAKARTAEPSPATTGGTSGP